MSANANNLNTTSAPEAIPMKDYEAITIIQKLIDGIHPLSDEPLSDKHLCLDSDIHRALQTAIPALRNQIKTDERRAKLPANAGTPWSDDEDQRLAEAFDNGDAISVLMTQHGRTRGSINSRLLKLGKITA
ncbi:hypothetical protein ACTXGJ_01770 [Psychrobacter sp. 1Y11]|uniref:hypothetical protein n=1 Tax=Psychrobacter sp. 1Y11 TaxID=3457446 RepID=UPI003FCFD4CE